MTYIKENISENLIKLRKESKLTQQEFAKIFNYSDKAVSRWEHGESLPDIDVLIQICDYYGVSFEWLIHKNEDDFIPKHKPSNVYKIAIVYLFIVSVFTIATIGFVYFQITDHTTQWILFIWACPLSFVISYYFARKWWQSSILKLVLGSMAMWTLITSIYLQSLPLNIWPIFFVGIPLQLVFILLTFIGKTKSRK